MINITDIFKRALLRMDRFHGNLEKMNILTYQDKIRLRQPGYWRPVLFDQEGHDRMREIVEQNKPLMISRLGSVELSCLRFYLEKRLHRKNPYSKRVKTHMANQAGFFPVDDRSLDAFSELYLKEIEQVDLMGVWFNLHENVICNEYCPNADLVELCCLESFRFANPWSALLSGKKVLVVHPFVESIRKQYTEKRHLLFPSPDVLPDFELKTIKSVQSIAGSNVDFANWFDAYQYMCDEIAKVDFDICLIGAGAYGLPLASFVKKMGKQSIHLGGVTQILFGIRGRRWEREYADSTAKLFNEHWIRPLASETPANVENIERGCYW
jgi:hypothetical protein